MGARHERLRHHAAGVLLRLDGAGDRHRDLAFARSVPADDLRRDDVVSIANTSGVRVTHRIVAVERADDRTVLTLKGDANASPDARTYPVSDADRVFAHVPKGGYVVSAIASPTGIFVGGLLVAVALFAAFGPGSGRPRGGRRRADVVAAGLVLVAMGVSSQGAPVQNTQAVSPTTLLSRQVVRRPHRPATVQCFLLGLPSLRDVSWPAMRVRLRVILYRVSTGAAVSTRQITGAASSTTYVRLTDFLLSPDCSGQLTFESRFGPSWLLLRRGSRRPSSPTPTSGSRSSASFRPANRREPDQRSWFIAAISLRSQCAITGSVVCYFQRHDHGAGSLRVTPPRGSRHVCGWRRRLPQLSRSGGNREGATAVVKAHPNPPPSSSGTGHTCPIRWWCEPPVDRRLRPAG